MQSTREPEPEDTRPNGRRIDVDSFSYPKDDWAKLKDELRKVEYFPSGWKKVEVQMPFSEESSSAVNFKKRMKSNAPVLMSFRSSSGDKTVDVLYKGGDDLRQDQVVLDMIKCFNQIWDSDQVQFTDPSGSATVKHLHYRVVTVKVTGHAGFVEMLPNFRTIDDYFLELLAGEKVQDSRELISTSVATFITGYALSLRDRHKANMGVLDGFQMAIRWQIPDNFRRFLKESGNFPKFRALCWEALESLQTSESLQKIQDCMMESLRRRDLAGDERYVELLAQVRNRVRTERAELEGLIDGKPCDQLRTCLKDKAHWCATVCMLRCGFRTVLMLMSTPCLPLPQGEAAARPTSVLRVICPPLGRRRCRICRCPRCSGGDTGVPHRVASDFRLSGGFYLPSNCIDISRLHIIAFLIYA
jgi:hypothetical protein